MLDIPTAPLDCAVDKASSAAQYIRMSTDSQDLSPEIQAKAMSEYAFRNGLTIVETYLDAGRSGLTLEGRPAMKRLLGDVAEDQCPYAVLLVYDISRWGRFQDTDASAYYEYHCRMHGVQVRYVQELFPASNTPLGSLLKNLKRAMAAEYSRELGVKTRAGHRAAVDEGFHLGSLPCLGIGRLAISKQRNSERPLAPNEHKAASREHVKWIRGPVDEVSLVRRIFHMYTTTEMSVYKLSQELRHEGVTDSRGKLITPWMLYSLLSCEALIGNFVWGRESHGRRRAEGEPDFLRVRGCIEPIVSLDVWEAAKAKRAKRAGTIRSKQELLAFLGEQVSRNPKFTAFDLKSCNGPSWQTYVKHFGSFAAALACLGLQPTRPGPDDYAERRKARRLGRHFCEVAEHTLRSNGLECVAPRRCGHLVIVNGKVRVRIQVIWRALRYGRLQWSLRKVYREIFDYVLVVRLNRDDTPFDSILLARDEYFAFPLWFPDDTPGASFERKKTARDVAATFARLGASPPLTRSRAKAAALGLARQAAVRHLPTAGN